MKILVDLNDRGIVDLVLSSFDADSGLKELSENFSRELIEGIKRAGVPLDSAVKAMTAVPTRYKRIKVRDPHVEFSHDYGIFTPSSLVDHIALAHHVGFNLFDLLDDKIGYATLQLGNEIFYFALMRNMPISALEAASQRHGFEYRLAIWDEKGEIIGFRNHYINPDSYIGQNYRAPAVEGYRKEINVDFIGKSRDLRFSFDNPNESAVLVDQHLVDLDRKQGVRDYAIRECRDDGIWVHPAYRRRRIGHTLDNIASKFIPKEILGMDFVLVKPGGEFHQIGSVVGYELPGDKGRAARDFFWAVGGYEDDLNEHGHYINRGMEHHFPRVMLKPMEPTIRQIQQAGLTLDESFSPTWQYARVLDANAGR